MSVIPGHGAAAPTPPESPTEATPAAAPAAAPAPPETPKEDVSSKAFQVLAKKERAMRDLQVKIKAEREQMTKDMEIVKRHRELESKGKENPLEVLQALGWDYDKLSQFMLNGGKKTAEITASDSMTEVQKLRQELAERDKQAAEKEKTQLQAQMQEAQDHFREEIGSYLEAKVEDFELTVKLGQQDLVFQTIDENFKRTGKIMEIEDAAKLVEGYLEDEELKKLEGIGKLRKRFQPSEPAKGEASPKTSPSPTLSNLQTSSTAPSLLPATTEADRLKRALAALGQK